MTIEQLFTLEEVAERLKVHVMTLKRAIASGELEAVELGGYKVTEQAVQDFLQAKKAKAKR